MEFFESGRKLRGFESGIQYALARLLVDPQFIYRFERAPANVRAGAVYRISDLELASRLSFFLWSSIPDEELLDVAAAGPARTIPPCSSSRRGACWPTIGRARWSTISPASGCCCGSSTTSRRARRSSTAISATRFAARPSCSSKRSFARTAASSISIDADYTFVDERLARHYGIPNVRGSRFRRVTLDEGARRGLLGHGSLLTVTSAGNRTSPVKRGKWILENLLGAPVPQPPPGVETNLAESTAPGAAPTSVRQRLEQHRANPSCASCHAVMDPVGFSLEHFDLIGK